MTLKNRVETAVTKIEDSSDIAEKFSDASATVEFNTPKGLVKPIGLLQYQADQKIVEINEQSDQRAQQLADYFTNSVHQLEAEAATAISRIGHFTREEFSPQTTYSIDKIYFVDNDIAYTPNNYPYVSGLSISADISDGKLTVLQGLTQSDIGTKGSKLPAANKTVITFDSLVPVNEGGTLNNAIEADLEIGQKIHTDGYRSPGDGGGCDYVAVPLGTGLNDMGSFIDANGVQLKAEIVQIKPELFGALINQESSVSINSAVNYAISVAERKIHVNNIFFASEPILGRGEVVFVGSGSIKGDGFYRRFVVNETARNPEINWGGDVVPKKHLKNLLMARDPVVVLTGSSTGTLQPNSLDYASTLYEMLKNRMRADIDPNITVHSRAIGGTTYTQLDSVASNMPDWAQPPGADWLEYIEALAPDAVFICMGSNDSSSISQDKLRSVINKIKSWQKPCDIVLMTQPAPSLSATGPFSAYSSRSGQEGRDFSAGLIRSFAKYYDLGLIDSNRLSGILVDGRDILSSSSRQVEINLGLNGDKYISSEECYDFSARLRFTGVLADIDSAFSTASNPSNPPRIKIGAGSSDSMFIQKNTNGKLRISLFSNEASDSGSGYDAIVTDIDFPSGDFDLEVGVHGTSAYVEIIGVQKVSFDIIRHGGLFNPSFGYYALTTGPWSVLTRFCVGEPDLYLPRLLASEMWGESSDSAGTKQPYGGNGVNHMTSLGSGIVWRTLLPAGIFKADTNAESGEYLPLVEGVGAKVVSCSGLSSRWIEFGGIVFVSGAFTVENNAVGDIVVTLTLPKSPGYLSSQDLSGVVSSNRAHGFAWADNSSPAKAYFTINTTEIGSSNYRFNLSYII